MTATRLSASCTILHLASPPPLRVCRSVCVCVRACARARACMRAFISPSAVTRVGSCLSQPHRFSASQAAPPPLLRHPPLLPQSSQPEPPVGVVNFIFRHCESTTAGRGGPRQVNRCCQPAPAEGGGLGAGGRILPAATRSPLVTPSAQKGPHPGAGRVPGRAHPHWQRPRPRSPSVDGIGAWVSTQCQAGGGGGFG